MKKIHVNTSKEYDVIIGEDLLENAAEYIKNVVNSKKILVVSDDNVAKIYLEKLERNLNESGFEVYHFIVENGEKSKSMESLVRILNFAAEQKLTRSDCIIALGGGVVGDLAGFSAAVYLRGIKFVQIPTSLLAFVDSSVGGKTAVDLDVGKNLAGAFYQPELVLCDYTALKTLPYDYFVDGTGEVIKYALLESPELFEHLSKNGKNFDVEYVISECVKMKRDIVVNDEFDTGKRMTLNLGHTVGHAIEKASDYTLSHGKCVAIGMTQITRAAVNNGLCKKECLDKLICLLKKFELPYETDCTFEELFDIMTSDKKIMGSEINVIVPRDIGKVEIIKMSVEEFGNFVKGGF